MGGQLHLCKSLFDVDSEVKAQGRPLTSQKKAGSTAGLFSSSFLCLTSDEPFNVLLRTKAI